MIYFQLFWIVLVIVLNYKATRFMVKECVESFNNIERVLAGTIILVINASAAFFLFILLIAEPLSSLLK